MKLKAFSEFKYTLYFPTPAYALDSTCSKSTESQNLRRTEVGRDLLKSSGSISMLKQGWPEQVAQDCPVTLWAHSTTSLGNLFQCLTVQTDYWLDETLKSIAFRNLYIYPFWISICLTSFTFRNLKGKCTLNTLIFKTVRSQVCICKVKN